MNVFTTSRSTLWLLPFVSVLSLSCTERTLNPSSQENSNVIAGEVIEQNRNATDSQNENAVEPDLGAIAWIEDERDRWLYVKKIRGDAQGAWATGDFIKDRNKIDIRTHDVAEFAIETSRIPINWNRPVVLGIDGLNTELKKREHSLIVFEIDKYGAWVVRE